MVFFGALNLWQIIESSVQTVISLGFAPDSAYVLCDLDFGFEITRTRSQT